VIHSWTQPRLSGPIRWGQFRIVVIREQSVTQLVRIAYRFVAFRMKVFHIIAGGEMGV